VSRDVRRPTERRCRLQRWMRMRGGACLGIWAAYLVACSLLNLAVANNNGLFREAGSIEVLREFQESATFVATPFEVLVVWQMPGLVISSLALLLMLTTPSRQNVLVVRVLLAVLSILASLFFVIFSVSPMAYTFWVHGRRVTRPVYFNVLPLFSLALLAVDTWVCLGISLCTDALQRHCSHEKGTVLSHGPRKRTLLIAITAALSFAVSAYFIWLYAEPVIEPPPILVSYTSSTGPTIPNPSNW